MVGTRDTPPDLQDAPDYSSGMPAPDPSLSDDKARQLARECYESSTNWLNAGRRLKWNDSLRAFQGMHPSGSKYLSGDYRYRSRLFWPKTRSMVRKAEAETAAAFFSNEDVVTIRAQDDDDPMQQASAEIIQRLLQYRLTKTIPWFLTLVGARQDAEVMGVAIGKAYWKYDEQFSHTEQTPKVDYFGNQMLDDNGQPQFDSSDVYTKTQDHPWVDLIAPENFRFDPGADWRNPIATSPYLIEMIPMYVSDVRAKIASGEWLSVSDSALLTATDLDDDVTRRAREQGRVPGKDHDAWKPRDFDICWVRENIIRYDGQDWHFYSLSSAGELLTKPKPLSDIYLQGIRPYVCGFIVPEAHKTYPSAKTELIRDMQTAINDVRNLRMDNVKLALNPRQFIARGKSIDPQDVRTFMPGKVITTESPHDDVVWDRPPEVTGSSFQEQDRINLDFDELTGGISNSSIQANKQVYEAVGNMDMMQGNASAVGEYEQRVFAETFVEPLITQLVKLEQAYETDPVILAIAGKEAQLFQKFGMNVITDELLKQELTVKVNVGIGATNPQKRLQNFLTAAQAVGELFGPAAAMGARFEEVVKEVFGLCGYKDGERFFEPGFDVHQAQAQMAQGKGGKTEDPNAKMAEIQADLHGKIALAQASQQAQAQQDADSRKMDMLENQQQFQYKMAEMQQKFQLEMEKERMKLGMQQHQQLENKPVASIQFKADDALNNVLSPLVHTMQQHGNALDVMMQHNQAMANQTAQAHQALAGAINNLAKAHSAKRKVTPVRDKAGRITHGINEVAE